MKLKLLIILLTFSFACLGQKQKVDNHQDINYKDITEVKGLIYIKSDTSLFTGRVIRYNRKMEPSRHILVVNGIPDKSGWIDNEDFKYIKRVTKKPLFYKGSHFDWKNNQYEYNQNNKRLNDENKKDGQKKLISKNADANNLSTIQYSNEHSDIRENYTNSIKDGLWEEYFENGNLMIIGNYVEGKKDGIWKEYYENGKLSSNSNYVHGKKENLLELYHKNGNIKGRVNYKDGKEDGIIEMYHINGLLMMNGKFKEGNQVGEWNFFDDNGELTNTVNYDN